MDLSGRRTTAPGGAAVSSNWPLRSYPIYDASWSAARALAVLVLWFAEEDTVRRRRAQYEIGKTAVQTTQTVSTAPTMRTRSGMVDVKSHNSDASHSIDVRIIEPPRRPLSAATEAETRMPDSSLFSVARGWGAFHGRGLRVKLRRQLFISVAPRLGFLREKRHQTRVLFGVCSRAR